METTTPTLKRLVASSTPVEDILLILGKDG